jgi:hypothetical protein
MFARTPSIRAGDYRVVQWSQSSSPEMVKVYVDLFGNPIPGGSQRMLFLTTHVATLNDVQMPKGLQNATNVLNLGPFHEWEPASALFAGYETQRLSGFTPGMGQENLTLTFLVKDPNYSSIFEIPGNASPWDEFRPRFSDNDEFVGWDVYAHYNTLNFVNLFPSEGWLV